MSSFTEEDLKSWNMLKLKAELKKQKLPVSGTKAALIQRLMTKGASTESKETGSVIGKKRGRDEIEEDKKAEGEDSKQPPTKRRRVEDAENDEKMLLEKEKGDEKKKEVEGEKGGDTLKIVCFNLNGVRSAAKKKLDAYLNNENAEIVCFSEMKADEANNPCAFKGYQIIWNECKKKGYAGSCVITKLKPLSVVKGIGCDDDEGRAITVEFEKFYLVNTYVPNSGDKLKFKSRRLAWDAKMTQFLEELQKKKPVIWTGDLNVAIENYDVYDGETNVERQKAAGFTPYERKNFRELLTKLDMKDSYRQLYPNVKGDAYTFFTKRGNRMKDRGMGWRLDYFVVSSCLMPSVQNIEIRKDVNCSDHVPLVLTIKNLV